MNRLIGITGGISSGKTTLCKKIIEDNPSFIYVDVDNFRRDLYKNDNYISELKKEIKELNKYDEIDSTILNKYIFTDEKMMNAYKRILYKYLFNYINNFENKTIIVEWALIINDDLLKHFNRVIYLDISKEIRLARLKDSDLTKEEILKRMEIQDIKDLDKYKSDKFMILMGDFDMREVNNFVNKMDCKFTLPENGGKVIWEVTHNCNYGCSYCMFSCKKNEQVKGELTTEECYHVIDELVKNGFKHLKVTGGEPFLRKDIIDILRYASKRMITDISTNASLMTPKIVEQLNEIDLKMVHVSLDGNKEEHESVRGKGTYEATIRGLKTLKKSKNRVRIGSVIHLNNENNLEGLIKDVIDIGASEIIFSVMEIVDGQDKSKVKTIDNNELGKEIFSLKEKYKDKIIVNYNFCEQPNYVKICPGGDKFLYINNFGLVSPCTWVLEKDKTCISKKSLRDNTLDDILSEEQLKRFKCNKKEGVCYGILQ